VNAVSPGSWNAIAAYMSPEIDRKRLQENLARLKQSAGMSMKAETKLRHLTELQYFHFLEELGRLNGIVYAVATDAGLNQPAALRVHQRIQSEKIVEHKDKMHHESARVGLQDLSNRVASLSPQLYVQLLSQVTLFATLLRSGILYYVQRYPLSLKTFRWRIDQKNSTKTEYEEIFEFVTPAFLQSIFLREPLIVLEGGDYSAFSRFYYPTEKRPTWLKDDYGIEVESEGSEINIGKLLRENHEFVDSIHNNGVQVADLLASGIRRCLRHRFSDNETAARLLGKLMVQNYNNQPPVRFLGFSTQELTVDDQAAHISMIMDKNTRPMLAR